jgi:ribosomal protein L11 methyltransferase
MNDYISLVISTIDDEQSDMLVAQLSHIGYEGFEEEGRVLNAFIPKEFYDGDAVREILNPLRLSVKVKTIEAKNWNEEWEKNFPPVIVEDFCLVRADFHPTVPGIPYEIVITPKMSFGTGHHATTYMMIQAMSSLDLRDKKLLDFGTGTGVLAILAEKMGAVKILAVDNDEWSVRNATENIILNNCSNITIAPGELPAGDAVFDVILANINRNVILEHLDLLWQHLSPEGVLIGSGVLPSDEEKIKTAATARGFFMKTLFIRENWMSFQLKKGYF